MRSHTLPGFWSAYRRLPDAVKQQARDAYRLFLLDPQHPGLHFKRAGKRRPVYSVRVSRNYRALGVLEDGDVIWFWIGPHDEYGRLLKRA